MDTNARTLQEGDTSLHIIAKRFTEEEAVILTLTLLSKGADPDYRNDVSMIHSHLHYFQLSLPHEYIFISYTEISLAEPIF